MIKVIFKSSYQGIQYSCYFFVCSILSADRNQLLFCLHDSSITDTFIVSSYKSFNILHDTFVLSLSPYYYNILVRIILDLNVHVYGAKAVKVLGGVSNAF